MADQDRPDPASDAPRDPTQVGADVDPSQSASSDRASAQSEDGPQGPAQDSEADMTARPDQGYGESGFTGDLSQGASGQVQDQTSGTGGQSTGGGLQSGMSQNDQAQPSQEGLGQNQQSYGSSSEQDTSGEQDAERAKLGAQGQTGGLGPAPGAADDQSRSETTGGPDLSKGASDGNQGGGGI